MSITSEQALTVLFATSDPATGAAADADATPTGTLYVNGTADDAVVTVTKITTGLYKAALTLPELDPGDVASLRIAATVSEVAAGAVVWQDTAQTPIDAALTGIGSVDDKAALAVKLLRNKVTTDAASGEMTVYDDDGTTVLFTADIYEDVAGTTPYEGTSINRKDRLA